jgi:hypothetical protein
MDEKQNKIWNKIKEENNIPDTAKLIQFRNLREFRYFTLERINPNHIIELHGKLKNGNIKRDVCLNVHVGRIIIPYMAIIFFLYSISPMQIINLLILISSIMLCATGLLYGSINIMRLFYDCFNRRYKWSPKFGFRKNSIYDS